MKTLIESLLDDEDVLLKNTGSEHIIEKFLKDNYKITGKYTIKDGLVNIKGNINANVNITELTNGLFNFNYVNGIFNCSFCKKLKSLKGAPQKCEQFDCSHCYNLKSLEGAPEKCEEFMCEHCRKLNSLKEAPKKCEKFYCYHCDSLITLEGAPKKCVVFDCSNCNKLISLEGAPEKCKEFYCFSCPNLKGVISKNKYEYIDNYKSNNLIVK